MGIFGNYTIEQLRKAVAEGKFDQIRTALKTKIDNLTNKQLIILILKVADIDVENFEIQGREEGEDGPNGQVYRIRTIRDVLGQFVKRERFDWTYYPGIEGKRPVHLITRTQLDGSGKTIGEPEVIAKHSPNGVAEENK